MSTNMSNATEEPSSSLRDEKLASVEISTLSVILVLAVTSNLFYRSWLGTSPIDFRAATCSADSSNTPK